MILLDQEIRLQSRYQVGSVRTLCYPLNRLRIAVEIYVEVTA